MTRLRRCLPFVQWARPSAWLLRSEAMAGLTVGLMVIPQGVAYAALAGMPLIAGIYASMLPALVAVLFSASVRLSVGPTALTCMLISASLTGLAQPGSANWVSLAVWLCFLSGAMQIGLGWARFGWLLNLVNSPVLMAFTQAAAVLIISSQVSNLLGLSGSVLSVESWTTLNVQSTFFGLGALLALWVSHRLNPKMPSVLMIALIAAGLSHWSGFEISGGHVVGALPGGMPSLYIPTWPGWQTLGQLVIPAVMITLVSFLETASSAKVDNATQGKRWNQNQDLIGQGLAKIASGLSGAFPTSSSFSRSALNLYAGAQTGWATIFSVLVVTAALAIFLPILHSVPQAVLAAIVVVAVYGLIKPKAFLNVWRISRIEAFIAGVTFVVTIATAPRLYWGVLVGVLMALSHFLYSRLHPRIIEVGLHADGRLRDLHFWKLPPLAPNIFAIRMDAALDFGSANALEQNILEHLALNQSVRYVVIFSQSINRIDVTGIEALERILLQLTLQKRTLVLVGMKLPVENVLLRADLLDKHPALRTFVHDAEALLYLQAEAIHSP